MGNIILHSSELPSQGLAIRPDAGDVVLTLSNFICERKSLKIFSGTKYSVVIMTGYND